MSGHLFESVRPWGYDVIVADPPWNFKSNSAAKPGRNPRRHYPCMSLSEIEAMPVKDIVADNAVLFFWITGPFLAIGAHIPIMKAWGFKPSTIGFNWPKIKRGSRGMFGIDPDLDMFMGTGFTTRSGSEMCVLGKRGRSLRVGKSVRQVIMSEVREHSRKPEEFRDRVEEYVGPNRRILELFARSTREGWTAWGNETEKFDVSHAD